MSRAFVLLLALLIPLAGFAKGQDSSQVADQAERLLEKLELERAREMLETAARDPKLEAAPPKSRARIWAVLGRARAETGDLPGMEDAFEKAVASDPKVALKRSASPKIRDALERARKAAPKPLVDKPKSKPEPKSKAEKPEKPKTEVPTETPSPAPEPRIKYRMEGAAVESARIRIVGLLDDVPTRAELWARIRIAPTTTFRDHRMVRTGTIAFTDVELGAEQHAAYLEARAGGKVIASAGSEAEPFVIDVKRMPGMTSALAEARPPPPPPVVPPPSLTKNEISEGPELWLFIGAGATLVLAATVATLVLASGSSTDCEAERGFGCAEIRVIP